MKLKKRLNKIIADNSTAVLGIKNSILHERINDRAEYPLANKFFFKERLIFDNKLRQEYRGR